jgi:SAM-dependent methyltransferase
VRPVWHPLSTLLLDDPPCFASPHVLRLLLRSEGSVRLLYAGDRMLPAVAHGARFSATPLAAGPLQPGTAVVACPAGIPDLSRVVADRGEQVELAADADPQVVQVARADVLALARIPAGGGSVTRRSARRLGLDLSEAWRHRPDARSDPARTVHDKYEAQADFYARSEFDLDPELLARIRAAVPAGRTIVVVGSGTGRECLALAEAGYRVSGLEFSAAMVRLSRKEATRRGVPVEFVQADVRDELLSMSDLGGVVFTYDVYSFLPTRSARVRVLARLRSWLAPGGAVLLSARRAATLWERTVLTVQWLAAVKEVKGSSLDLGHSLGVPEWGDSHTRWIASDGTLCRSFVRVFTRGQLRREAAEAGLRMGPWEGGHAVLR